MRITLVFVLLALGTPAFAESTESTESIDKQIRRTHAELTEYAIDVCECETAACLKKAIAPYDAWNVELIMMRDRDGFKDLVARIDADADIQQQIAAITSCQADMLARPWRKSCQKRIASAAAAFEREAPKAFPIYKTLSFESELDERDEAAIAAARIHPGRSWVFRAWFAEVDDVASEFDVPVKSIPDDWKVIPTDRSGVIAVKRMGPWAAALLVNSERFANHAPRKHPLTKLFLSKLGAAVDKCIRK